MQLILEIQNKNELQLLLQYVKLLQTVKIIGPQIPQKNEKQKPPSLFQRYYGAIKSNETIDEIDEQLKKLREEWTRDI